MNKNNRYLAEDEIDLREITISLWKKKFFILITTLIFTIAGYIYSTLQHKVYQSTFTIRDAPEILFEKYKSLNVVRESKVQKEYYEKKQEYLDMFITSNSNSIASNFNQEFKLNLISIDNLINFVEQNKKLDEFKSYLKKNNIETRAYFQNKYNFEFIYYQKNKKQNQYTFTFSKTSPVKDFIDDYIIYTKQVAENIIREQLIHGLKNQIEIYNQNIEIAKIINLEDPIIKFFRESKFNTSLYEHTELFYKGTIILSKEKFYLEQLLKQTENLTLNYNPILDKASIPDPLTKSEPMMMGIAFFIGLIFSISLIFIRSRK
jgi:LPS O-antigen subunit length determinant protein (WzzB/FepE family)